MWEAFLYTSFGLAASWVFSVFRQLFLHDKTEPPAVFHWIPYVGSAVAYGSDPVAFFEKYRAKYGDIFTFTLFGRSVTVYLGPDGNEFILNGKHADINAEEIYGPLTTPVFGKDVVYDCPNAKLMEQKRFVKFGLTQRALEGHVGLVEGEVLRYVNDTEGRGGWIGEAGEVDICAAMAEITLFTAARSLQGREVREKLTAEMAELYHDLDMGFAPVNFLFPGLPLPRNRKRDIAHAKMRAVYLDLIQQRHDRLTARPHIIEDEQKEDDEHEHDMITNLMQSVYKNGTPVSDSEIANMMITLLMGGQHSSSSASSWIMLELAANPDVAEALYQEQLDNLLPSDHLPTTSKTQLPPLTYADLDKLPLLHNVVKETLRLHGSIHSIMRKVKNPLRVPGTPYVVSTDKVLLASPMVTAVSDEFFEDAKRWNPRRWDATAGDSKNKEEPSDQDTIDYGYGAVAKSSTRNPYLPFGAGRHRCIGEKFAYLNLGVIVATIVREFELSTLDGSRGVVPKTDHSSMFARPAAGSMIRWRRRK
ncbi:cytochrome P450 51 [Microdochium trichocladiopsis]|uniref:Cytochrome P450 51 n=1 Tax=Microdochium trichocladiopsis TaxID=1682393 RepID=A0A9P9BNU8_9PEZI|nr:cytochrome P450 51 [Microdochium trichocladiopsis]KAH7028103.1 cytochrome P450 51 [Microdochium trichocladiopsis]